MLAIVRWVLVTGILVGVAFTARLAHADDPLARPKSAAAAEHLDQGNKLYNLRSFVLAAEQYKAGALLDPAPVFDYNLGQTFRQLGQYEEAIWHYERFLKSGQPRGKMLEAVNNFIEKMKAELSRKAMTEQPDEPAPGTAAKPPRPAVIAPAHPPALVSDPRREPWYDDGIGWGLAGAGVVAAGAAAWLFIDAGDLDEEAERPGQSALLTEKLHDRADSRRLFGTITAVAGGGLLAAGIVKLVLRPKDELPTATAWRLGIARDGVVVFGRF